METKSIGELTPENAERAGVTLAQAFETDPMFEWMFPDEATRPSLSLAFSKVPLRYGLRFGRATQLDEAKAVAVWMPPEKPLSLTGLMRCGLPGMPFHIGFAPFGRFMNANAVMGKFHDEHMTQPHWYLFVIGVSPEAQGRGLGTALINEGLQRADQAGHPCYLETSSERNLPFYERFGFSIIGEAPLGKSGPTGWAMRREPN